MKRKLFYVYAFVAATVLFSSARLLNANRTGNEVCKKACGEKNKIETEKSTKPALFLPTHFI